MPAPITTACLPIRVDAIATSQLRAPPAAEVPPPVEHSRLVQFAHCLDSGMQPTFASQVRMSQFGSNLRRWITVALVRRSECVPNRRGSKPTLAIHLPRRRAYCREYCRVVRLRFDP